jgi:peptide/nickel transport system substrate-binding protein
MRRFGMLGTLLACLCLTAGHAAAQSGGELRFGLGSEPKTFNPLLAADDSSETIRYLTGGVLIRLNRQTQELQPELALSWKVSEGGRRISFELRKGVAFSDGVPFSAEDVAYTMRALMDPNLHSPTGDSFRSAEGRTNIDTKGPNTVSIEFPAPVANLERLFDQVAILSSRSTKKELAALGPFYVADHKPGSYVLLKRNPNYWKRDSAGRPLPYLDSVRLEIQQNRDLELLRFLRGELHLINSLDAEYFDRLRAELPGSARDEGPAFDTEQMWFNQVAAAPIPAYRKAWFRSQNFRRAISESISRSDLARIVYGGHARPAVGPVSPANRFWFNKALQPQALDREDALKRLREDGFHLEGDELRDGEGHRVEFSIITNAGNKARERMAAMIQDDLSKIGIRLNVVTLDFPSLIERITHTFDYEACLLGLVNDDLDPSAQMNVWLSSASNHQWNPGQKSPETPWEAEIDRLMRAQASTTDPNKRKVDFDRVQQIAWEQVPFIYLVNKNALSAISPTVRNAAPVVLRPQTYWNAENLYLLSAKSGVHP